jgi:membrane protein
MRGVISKSFFKKINDDKIFELSAALSYYTALSLAPLLILLVVFVSLIDTSFKNSLLLQIENYVGLQGASAIKMIADSAKDLPNLSSLAGLVAILTLFFSAGAIFGQLRRSLNLIFEVPLQEENPHKKSSLFISACELAQQQIFNMSMVVIFILITAISLTVSSIVSLYFEGAQYYLHQAINFLFTILVFSILFSGVYYLLPKKRIPSKTAIVSGILTSILFSLGNALIGFYVGRSAIASTYGAMGSLIALLVWSYYSSLVIFLSAELSHYLQIGHLK